MPNKVLILFAHPAQDLSEVNVSLFQAASTVEQVTCVDLYADYPHHDIDIPQEQERLRAHDVVIFLFPLYWYSTPAILKDWMDLVLEYNFAYGRQGNQLKGKTLLAAVSAGGTKEMYQQEGYNRFGIHEFLRPIEQTARFCQMQYSPPFTLFGSRTARDDDRLISHIQNWKKLLRLCVADKLDLALLENAEQLNEYLEGCAE